jgi:hypothetical protein
MARISDLSVALPQERMERTVLEGAREAYFNVRQRFGADRPDADLFRNVVASAGATLDTYVAPLLDGHVPGMGTQRVACRAGCTPCCHQHTYPTAAELAVIVLSVSPGDRQVLADRARAIGARSNGLSHHERFAKAIPCPLLENGRCGVYALRPLVCRTYLSTSKRACDHDWRTRFQHNKTKGVPLLVQPQVLGTGYSIGLDIVLYELGLETERAEMAPGLVAMCEDQGAERWLAGEPVLFPVRHLGLGGGPESDHLRSIRDMAERARRERWAS